MQKGKGSRGHDNSEDHNISMIKWGNYMYIQDKKGSSNLESLNSDRKSVVEYNREYLKLFLEYHKYFCSHEMAYKEDIMKIQNNLTKVNGKISLI